MVSLVLVIHFVYRFQAKVTSLIALIYQGQFIIEWTNSDNAYAVQERFFERVSFVYIRSILYIERVRIGEERSGSYFMKVKIILSLKFKINLIFYLIKEFMKHSCLNFFYEIVNKISIKVKRNWNLKNSPRLKDGQFFLNPDLKKILTFMK